MLTFCHRSKVKPWTSIRDWIKPVKLKQTAERRQITVLHCDIVNSTAIVDALDPEDVLAIMESNLNNWVRIVEAYRGIFVSYTGDGFHAYFGYPIAREDAAADAVNAGLEVTRMFAKQENEVQRELKCRVGIATGQVVVGRPSVPQIGQHFVAFGSVPTMAARLEQAASPGSVLVDQATMRLASNQFEFSETGVVPAKGFSQDVQAWEAVQERRPVRRFDTSDLTPYVNRAHELGMLSDRWQSVMAGRGQVVILQGEAGIGKSRLVYEFERSLGSHLESAFRFQCSSQNTSTALHPWFHWVLRYGDIRQQDSAETIHAKLDESLHSILGFSREVVAASEAIMGVQHKDPDQQRQDGSSSQKVLSRLQRALVRNIINAAKDAPLYVLVEDVHWMDASTEGLIRLLAARVHRKKIFLMLTCRPQRVPSFDYPHVSNLTLGKLEDDAVSELVANFFDDSDETIDQSALMSTIGKCEGNPLFVEELSKHYLERKSPDSLAVAQRSRGADLPILLQASLLARIDTAGEGKEIAQLASVIGREFDRDILIRLAEQPEDEVDAMLDQLGALGILSPHVFNERAFFAFRHALLREAVYSSLLSKAREAIHLRVARLLVDARQTYSAETIARHFEHGGDHSNAFDYWLEAGQHALESGATTEAVNLLGSALRMTRRLTERDERLDDFASANLSYALALNASHGVVAEPIKYFRKAEKLAARVNKTEMLLESLDWQFGMQFNAGELGAAKGPAQKIKRLGIALGDRRALASGSQGLGMVYFMRGELTKARREFEQGLEAAADYVSGVHCFPSMSLSYLAWTYFILGQSAKASSSAKRAIASARKESTESAHALATALSNCSYVFQCLGDVESVYACAAELVEHARKHGELMYLKRGTMTRKWADFVSGMEDQSIEAIRDHIDLLLESREEIEVTFHLGVLADLQIRKRRYREALSSIDQALKLAHKNDEFFYVAELYRLKAHIHDVGPKTLSSQDDADYIALAKATAKAQKAKAWLDKLAVTSQAR